VCQVERERERCMQAWERVNTRTREKMRERARARERERERAREPNIVAVDLMIDSRRSKSELNESQIIRILALKHLTSALALCMSMYVILYIHTVHSNRKQVQLLQHRNEADDEPKTLACLTYLETAHNTT